MARVFTGMRPTNGAKLHLGNLLGVIPAIHELTKNNTYEFFVFMADLHAIVGGNISYNLDVLRLFMTVFGHHKNFHYFRQSDFQDTSFLSWVCATKISVGQLERMTQFKSLDSEKTDQMKNGGLLFYPTLMAADCLGIGSNIIPVGMDQTQHIELARDVAHNINRDVKLVKSRLLRRFLVDNFHIDYHYAKNIEDHLHSEDLVQVIIKNFTYSSKETMSQTMQTLMNSSLEDQEGIFKSYAIYPDFFKELHVLTQEDLKKTDFIKSLVVLLCKYYGVNNHVLDLINNDLDNYHLAKKISSVVKTNFKINISNEQLEILFNKLDGFVVHEPQIVYAKICKLLDLRNNKKMSKTNNNDDGILYLKDSNDDIRRKIKGAVTDSEPMPYDVEAIQESRPAIYNLCLLYDGVVSLGLNSSGGYSGLKTLGSEFGGQNISNFKNALTEVVINFLEPFRAKFLSITDEQIENKMLESKPIVHSIISTYAQAVENMYLDK